MNDSIQTLLLCSILVLLGWQIYQSRGYAQRKPGSKLLAGAMGRSGGSQQRSVILDSCALIDGRILDLSKSGFVPENLIVPEFILHELQLLADGNDSHKRERARYGLDVVKELQGLDQVTVTLDKTELPKQPTDDMLLALATKLRAPIYTTDYNLSKLADIGGMQVLNVNELAQQLRPAALPGEKKTVKILQKGSNPKQGVGYLDDGTMVVVDGGAKMLGQTAEVEITRVHQTVAGKMLFAELKVAKSTAPALRRRSADPGQTSSRQSIASRLRSSKPRIQ